MLSVLFVLLISLPLTAHYPMLNGEDKGCAHDGSDVDVGDWVMVGCDNCTCTPGKIVCPVPPTCPRNCSYKGISHRHGESFYNSDTCDECECKDGTVTCVFKDCNDACTVNGLHYDKGETFKIDCETCQCLGQDVIRCNKHFCPCFVDNQIIQHGGESQHLQLNSRF